MKQGWLVNDCLTCIPDTKTFWHDLLENIPGLEDKTDGLTPFNKLANKIKMDAYLNDVPDYIIRNATYFPKIELPVKTVSLLQDIAYNNPTQIDVCNSSDITVFNSNYVASIYKDILTCETRIIPLGIDFDFFTQSPKDYSIELGILPDSILFVGTNTVTPKGFDKIKQLIESTDYNFCLVMKDNSTYIHDRVKVFNCVSQDMMRKIYNSCKLLVCSSTVETQHLSGLEAAACGLPIVATDVGLYYGLEDGDWGMKVAGDDFVSKVNFVFNNLSLFSPREYFLEAGYDKSTCVESWKKLIEEL